MPDLAQQLLDVNQKLLTAIVGGDWKTYESLCDPSITCFEPEARGQIASGMAFHKYYFELPGEPSGLDREIIGQLPSGNCVATRKSIPRLISGRSAV